MATSKIQHSYFLTTSTTNSGTISAGGTGWVPHNAPTGHALCVPVAYYIQGTGATRCSVYAFTLTSTGMYNSYKEAANVTVTVYWLCID